MKAGRPRFCTIFKITKSIYCKGTFIKDVPFFVTFLRYLPTLVLFCPIFRYIPKIGRPTLTNIPTPAATSLTINLLSIENSKCLYKSNFY